jgi:hypothetical protein
MGRGWRAFGESRDLPRVPDHLAIMIQSLNGLHVDVTKSLMVKKKFFLRLGQVLVLIG